MNWGRLDDPAWWWEYALDGLIGGIIGGLVTALAVWLTLRHERRLSAEAGERQAVADDRAEARSLASRVQSKSWQLNLRSWPYADWKQNLPREFVDLVEAMLALSWTMEKRWPTSSVMVQRRIDALLEAADEEEVARELSAIGGLVGAWISDSERVERKVTTPPAGAPRRTLRGPWRGRGPQPGS